MGHFRNITIAIALVFSGVSMPAALAQTGQTLNNDSLKAMLDGLGYSPKALSKGYLVDIKQDAWEIYIQLVLSPNNGKLGMNANLGQIEDLDAVPAKRWLDLLISNGDIDPSTFYVDRDQKKIYLHRVLDNREITPAFLREQIEAYVKNLRDTESLWSFTK